jgi:hypothetical protein
MGTPYIEIRAAIEGDAVGIAHAHYSAVHELAGTIYASEILDEWSPTPCDARYEQFRRPSRMVTNDSSWRRIRRESLASVPFFPQGVNSARCTFTLGLLEMVLVLEF